MTERQKSKSVRDVVADFCQAMASKDFKQAYRIRRGNPCDPNHFKFECRRWLEAHPTEAGVRAWFEAQIAVAKVEDDQQERAVYRPWTPHEETMRQMRATIINKFGRTAARLSGIG